MNNENKDAGRYKLIKDEIPPLRLGGREARGEDDRMGKSEGVRGEKCQAGRMGRREGTSTRGWEWGWGVRVDRGLSTGSWGRGARDYHNHSLESEHSHTSTMKYQNRGRPGRSGGKV